MADFESLIRDIQANVGGLSEKIAGLSETEGKVSKIVDTLGDLPEQADKTYKEMQEEQDSLKGDVDAMKKRVKHYQLELDSKPDGNYRGMFSSERKAETFGHYVMATVLGRKSSQDWLSENDVELRAMSEGVGSGGGFLVPTVLQPELIRLVESYGVFRANARNVPLASDQTAWPKRNGGLTVYVPGEGTAVSTSDVSFENVNLVPKKLATLTAVSTELDEDSVVAVGEIVGQEIAQAFALAEDQAGFLGDGTSTYWGFTGATQALRGVDATIGNVVGITVGAGNAYSELTDANFHTLMGNIPNYADIGGGLKYYMHRIVYYSVCVRLAMAAGGANATELLNLPGGVKSWHGYPVEFTQAMPSTAANSQLAIFFANLQQGAYLGNRRQMQVDQSRDVYFANDQIGIRGTERIGINVHDVGDTSNAGAVTALAMAAS